MDLPIDVNMKCKAVEAEQAAEKAELAARKAREAFDEHIRKTCVAIGLGKGAMVTHVHSRAHHGKQSERMVISEVRNACASALFEPQLIINLGRVNGGQGYQYARLAVSDVIRQVQQSYEQF